MLICFYFVLEQIINIICSSKIIIRHILLKKDNRLRSFYSFSANFRLEITSTADIYRKYLLYEIFCYDSKDKKVLVCR